MSTRIAGIAVLLLGLFCPSSRAGLFKHPGPLLDQVNARIAGHVVDYTNNHGADRRIWSAALGEKRDLYVYLPPGFDPHQCYPLILWLHGFTNDELAFLEQVVDKMDRAILEGVIPPLIICSPDGSLQGRPGLRSDHSAFNNTPKGGCFEDFLMQDVWDFMFKNYPLRPERAAHAIAGGSLGGTAAFNKAFRFPERFQIVVGIYPPLNLRWLDCHGRYMGNFDPNCWGWRENFDRSHEVVGRFGLFAVRQKRLVDPLYGRHNPETRNYVARENPIEMLDVHDVREGQFSMYIAYGGKDEFNVDAQVESFLYRARERGLSATVAYDPKGRHNSTTALKFLPAILDWLRPQLIPYAPALGK